MQKQEVGMFLKPDAKNNSKQIRSQIVTAENPELLEQGEPS